MRCYSKKTLNRKTKDLKFDLNGKFTKKVIKLIEFKQEDLLDIELDKDLK